VTVKPLLIACVLLGIGCHEEPPIVIKFEPADAAAKAVTPAPVAVADAAAVAAPVEKRDAGAATAEKPGPKGKTKPTAPECKVAADCEVAPVECCSCANGGKQKAVTHKVAAQLEKERPNRCKGIMCTMMVSTDPTCGKRPDCVDGQCTMIDKKK